MIVTAALVATLVAVLVVTQWRTVRDHVEAWNFQMTTETEVFEPFSGFQEKSDRKPGSLVQELADYSGRKVLSDIRYGLYFRLPPLEPVRPVKRVAGATRDVNCIAEIEAWGWRVIEQRFPQRTYVVIRDGARMPELTE